MKRIKVIKNNFIQVFSKWYNVVIFISVAILIEYVFIYFTNLDIIVGNLGYNYMLWQIIFQTLISILFGLFVPISLYKILEFNSFSIKENLSSGGGTFLGLLVAGCPACSITLASYLGLSSIISFLPWYGLELKIMATLLLFYANYSLLKDLNICKIKF
mgnify:CR=1 FL=1